jgi:hypothetical protein
MSVPSRHTLRCVIEATLRLLLVPDGGAGPGWNLRGGAGMRRGTCSPHSARVSLEEMLTLAQCPGKGFDYASFAVGTR